MGWLPNAEGLIDVLVADDTPQYMCPSEYFAAHLTQQCLKDCHVVVVEPALGKLRLSSVLIAIQHEHGAISIASCDLPQDLKLGGFYAG
jgi:hypothetical protein